LRARKQTACDTRTPATTRSSRCRRGDCRHRHYGGAAKTTLSSLWIFLSPKTMLVTENKSMVAVCKWSPDPSELEPERINVDERQSAQKMSRIAVFI
jgi:hypothetical protein